MSLAANLRFTLRLLRRNPALAASAILATGLGIGATSAMFSITDGILLHPLPFPGSDRLVNIWETQTTRNIPKMVVAPGNYYDWRVQAQSLSAIGAFQGATFNLAAGDAEPERFLGAIADPGFFTALGVSPMLGRIYTEAENEPGQAGVVILSYAVWQQRFGADRTIIGRALDLNGHPRTVVGVMPQGFEYPAQAVMWSPLELDGPTSARRDFHRLRVIGRLKDNVSLAQSRAEFQAIAARLATGYPDFNAGETSTVNPLLADLVGTVRPALLVLLAAVVAVLLIACANVANLLLAKASGRQREIAIRTSMGASRRVILGQMLTESGVLSLLGGVAGLLMAKLALRGLISLAPAGIPRLAEIALDARIVGLAMALSIATGLLFGLAPAWFASRIDVNSMLKEGMRGSSARNPLRSLLVAAQVAIALVLLSGAGLLIRSFYEVARVDAGFDPEHLMTMQIVPALTRYRAHPELQIQLARGILDKVSAIRGVRSSAISTSLPLTGNPQYIMRFEGRPPVTPSQSPLSAYFAVTPGFFETMAMKLIRGRLLTERDVDGTPLVVVVNQTLVDRYFPHQDPLGKRLEIGFADPPRWRQIVGVVRDVKAAGLDQDTPVQVYTAQFQTPSFPSSMVSGMTILARTSGDPASLAGAIHSAILSVDRGQPVYAIQPMAGIVSTSIAQRRLSLILLAFFAASAMLLAAIGVYGVMSFVVAQRTSEIGIRMALGARAGQVAWHVQWQGMRLVAAGLVPGAAGALLLTRYLNTLLFRVDARDPLIFGTAAITLIVVSVIACWLPARRASRVDPLTALRNE